MRDVLYVAWNRLEFTQKTFDLLLKNTDWSLVDRLIIYDDSSTDGTKEYLYNMFGEVIHHVPTEYHVGAIHSPPGVMNWYVRTFKHTSEWFIKVDNDIALPPGWLLPMVTVSDQNPEIELLGMEPGMTTPLVPLGYDGEYTFEPSSHIGGVGLMKTEAFTKRKPPIEDGRFGFTEWQHDEEHHNALVRGWTNPSIVCPQLDRLPVEPWVTLSEKYVDEGWSRGWSKYHMSTYDEFFKWVDND